MVKKKLVISFISFISIFIFSVTLFATINNKNLYATEITEINTNFEAYEMNNENDFNYENYEPIKGNLCYGAANAGNIILSGKININTKFREVQAYGVDDLINIKYVLTNNDLSNAQDDKWSLTYCGASKVSDIQLDENVGMGVAIVQKSLNKYVWETVSFNNNIFDSKSNNLYITEKSEIENGCYYKVIVAYELRKKNGEKKVWDVWPFKSHWESTYEYKRFVEVSVFYLCSNLQTIQIKEYFPKDGTFGEKKIKNNDIVEYGFIIEKTVSDNLTSVETPSGEILNAENGDIFLNSGYYTVTEVTKLGIEYKTSIKVNTGTFYEMPTIDVYINEDNQGYKAGDEVISNNKPYANIKIVNDGNSKIKNGERNNIQSFGIRGTKMYFYISLNKKSLPFGYRISNDSWGKYENEYVNEIQTGEVATGALLLQKSSDGNNWKLCDSGIYRNGVFTTDYERNYGRGSINFYNPSGNEILNGEYYKVIYAYEITNGIEYKNIIEISTFFVCSDNVDAVTFHNLSLEGKIDEELKNEESIVIDITKKSETLTNGSVTVTGFLIDSSLNPTANITIKKDFNNYIMPKDYKIIENGRYDINVKTLMGTEKNITIFVCRQTVEELYSLYFKEQFIDGKRIFSRGDYPTYEGGLTIYSLPSIYETLPSLWGTIENLYTGETFSISQGTKVNQGIINEAGEYIVKLNTNNTYSSDQPSGDNHVFTFHFNVIANGTAPGPQVNKENLIEYGKSSNASNSYPVYYGVTYSSAHKGYITLAFATEKAAMDYAYSYAKGTVEKQSDGSYRYDGNLKVAQKVKYDSKWDLTDAIYYFASQAVQKLYFDLNDEFTYSTLSNDIIASTENLRSLELAKSVVVFANEEEKEKLLNNNCLPIINSKKYNYIVPGKEGNTLSGFNDFVFIRDLHGYDSDVVSIIDVNGNKYDIKYGESVEKQLREFGCKTGIITIVEETIYGDSTTYQAVYISENDNTTEFDLKYFVNKKENIKHIAKNDNSFSLTVNAFYFDNFVDKYDPYGLIVIDNGVNEIFYCIDDCSNVIFSEAGVYNIKLINRLGYYYSFTLKIEESYYSVSISGEGADGLSPILYADGDIVNLPKLSRYGYDFIGYKTTGGSIYSDEVAAILLKGSAVLETVWKAKQFFMTLIVENTTYQVKMIAFGESYSLPVLESSDLVRFVGWKYTNNETITNINIDKEGDIQLVACFEKIEVPPSIDNDIPNNNNIFLQLIKYNMAEILYMVIGVIMFLFIWGIIFCKTFGRIGSRSRVLTIIIMIIISIVSFIALLIFTSFAWYLIGLIMIGIVIASSIFGWVVSLIIT